MWPRPCALKMKITESKNMIIAHAQYLVLDDDFEDIDDFDDFEDNKGIIIIKGIRER